jgi:glycosyltransferase involved in cell wall biosynthesis
MTRLIVVGPVPPPHHGVTISTSLVLANPHLRERFGVEHLDTSDHRSGDNVGRWDLENVARGVAAVARLAGRLRGDRGLVYLPVSQGLAGLTRDTLLIRAASARGWKIAAHLRGGEIGDVYRRQPPPVRAWLRAAFMRLDSVAVLGESLRSTLDGLVPPDRVVVVPNGTPDPHPNGIAGESATGLFLGNLRRRKGVLEALRAAVMVVERRPNARFVFVGESREASIEPELRSLAAQGDGRIEIRSPVTGEKKRELLCSSGFLLFPPIEPEGHPRVVLESIAAGLPVVATDRGAIAETVIDGESGFVLPDPDPAELADRMMRLIDDRELHASMSRAARARYLERFTEEKADLALTDWLGSLAA